jgi:putative membrane protein
MYWDHMNGWGWTMMVLWSLIWIGFLGVVAWVAVQWARGGPATSAGGRPPTGKTARELLDERLARGEIDLDEYQRRREALEAPARSQV